MQSDGIHIYFAFLLLCLVRTSATGCGTDACKNSALLQIQSESTRGQMSSSPFADHATREAQEALWQSREFHLVPHHKTGTVMAHQAAENMIRAAFNVSAAPLPHGVLEDAVVEASYSDNMEELVSPSDLPIPWIEASMHGMGLATDPSMMQTSENPKCIAHIMRNPFEVVVSGYMYHKAGSEAWLGVPFSDAATTCHWTYFAPIVEEVSEQEDKCYRTYCQSAAQVMRGSVSGPASFHLPDVDPSESYSEYLDRVNVTAGLIAESIWAANSSLEPMRFVRDFTEASPCSANVCLSEFYADCKSAWAKVLQAWEIPEPHRSALLSGAIKSCPGTSEKAKEHSSTYIAESASIEHPPEREMIAIARGIDRDVFGGRLAAIEADLGCPARGRYTQS